MRVLVVTQYFWPENFRINDIVGELVNRKHQVTVLTGIPNYPNGKVFRKFKESPKDFSSFKGATVIRVPIFARGKTKLGLILNYLTFAIAGSTFGRWRLRRLDVDIVFVFGPSPITAGLPAVFIGKQKKVPVVFWTLDLWPETLQALGVVRHELLLRPVARLVRFIYSGCDLILGQSKSFLSKISLYTKGDNKLREFPNWAEDIFDIKNPEPANEVSIASGKFVIVFAGNIGEAQDFPAILRAIEMLRFNKNIHWLIVGDGSRRIWLEQEINRRGLEDCVSLPGAFPLERMPSFYACASALLVTLRPDPVFSLTIPGKLQTYLLSGIPILAMLDGEGAQVLLDAKAGIVSPAGDFVGLVEAVKSMSNMSQIELSEMGLRGREFAGRRYDRRTVMNKLEFLFSEAISKYKER